MDPLSSTGRNKHLIVVGEISKSARQDKFSDAPFYFTTGVLTHCLALATNFGPCLRVASSAVCCKRRTLHMVVAGKQQLFLEMRFCPEHVFRAPNLGPDRLDPDRFVQEAAAPRATGRFKKEDTRAWQVLQHAPALVPFEDRARLFQTKVAETRYALGLL
ncbi:hypothetical protein DUNSADRAFT_10169 [Dunaliella salina]|uniref:Encoded protein n=1 Tax=Dunaliella salina TaxID=3046 RepID=A0ABQ7GFY4_DUNSA|nr:hypothetical protein DUNSADRAFT_10169 [Dunaliella salina]|eukprot:KAF5833518.1 hypothetical protein DUNSADRAFT_10169 [Dunaliella salina]